MRNIKLIIEYDGTRYAGWQVQPGQRTIQGTIESALRKVLGEGVRLVASGRTDTGVHAKGQVANFKTIATLAQKAIKDALNAILPQDIAIKDCQTAPLSFNARFDAKIKHYRYTIYNSPERIAINRQYVCRIRQPLNIGLMKKEAKALVGRKNFKSFHAAGRKINDFVRRIKKIEIKKDKDSLIYIDISADGFLYNMARNIVGTLIEIGRGKMPAGSAKAILRAKDRTAAGPTIPSRGLCLMQVKYY